MFEFIRAIPCLYQWVAPTGAALPFISNAGLWQGGTHTHTLSPTHTHYTLSLTLTLSHTHTTHMPHSTALHQQRRAVAGWLTIPLSALITYTGLSLKPPLPTGDHSDAYVDGRRKTHA